MKKIILLIFCMILLVGSASALVEFPLDWTYNPANKLIALYHFNESLNANAIDSAGHGHDGTSGGTTTRTAHFSGLDNAFDGTSTTGCFTVNDAVVFGNNVTVCIWVNMDGDVSQQYFLKTNGFYIGSTGGGKMQWYDSGTISCSATDYSGMGDLHWCYAWYGTKANCYVNGSLIGSPTGTDSWGTETLLYIGDDNGAGSNKWDGYMDDLVIINETLNLNEIRNIYNGSFGAPPPPPISYIYVNITYPVQAQHVNNNFYINLTTNISVGNCTTNDTRWNNYSGVLTMNITLDNITSISDGNYSVNVACIEGMYNGSNTVHFSVDTTAPTITIHPNSFFNISNNTILTDAQSKNVTLNFTFNDNFDLLAFEINITDPLGNFVYNITDNTTMDGLEYNFTTTVNISGGNAGTYTTTIQVWDSHTLKTIQDMKVRKGMNYLLFDNKIRIKADDAIYSSTTKLYDRYTFEFTYLPFFTPKTKTFYVESDWVLTYREDSLYKAHFVDFKNKRWIDFEGIDTEPTVTKINNYKWKIVFSNADNKVIINSIGGLNTHLETYTFEIDKQVENIVWHIPSTNRSIMTTEDTFDVSLNVTDTYRNRTVFYLYNESDLISNATVNKTGNGTYQYNYTFTNLNQTTYYINATHTDLYNNSADSITLTIHNFFIDNYTLYNTSTINFTLYDEGNQSLLIGNIEGTFNYSIGSIYKTYEFDVGGINTTSICMFPPYATINTDYVLYYDATNYPQRRYYVNDGVLTNATSTLPLYLLHSNEGIYARFRVVDPYNNPISGVGCTMQRTIRGILRTIEQENTDDSGLATFWVNPDKDSLFTFTKTGYETESFTLRPTTSEIYTVTLGGEGEAEELLYSTGIAYKFSPSGINLNNNTYYNFTFNLTSSYWHITDCILYLKNGSDILIQNSTSYSTSECNIRIEYSTGNLTSITSEAIYELNQSVNKTVSVQYSIAYTYVGQFSLRNFLNDLKALRVAGFNDFTRIIIAFIVIFAIVATASSKMGLKEPEPLIILTFVLVVFFSYLGWLTLNYDAIPNLIFMPEGWLQQYIIMIIFLLGAGGYILKRHTE